MDGHVANNASRFPRGRRAVPRKEQVFFHAGGLQVCLVSCALSLDPRSQV